MKGEVPPLTQVSVADFKEGTYFEDHDHEDMFEMHGLEDVAYINENELKHVLYGAYTAKWIATDTCHPYTGSASSALLRGSSSSCKGVGKLAITERLPDKKWKRFETEVMPGILA